METLDQTTMIWIAAITLLGASGTFLLLPHGHGLVRPLVAHRVGYALIGLAVSMFAALWHAPAELLTRLFFYGFGISSVLGAVLTVTSRNPIYSALYFASVVLSTSGLFLLSGAQFLAAGTIIVYAGAIIVTFLFVIMLAQMEGRAIYDRTARSPFWATFSAYLLLFGLMYALLSHRAAPQPVDTADARDAIVARPRLVAASTRATDPAQLTPDQRAVVDRAVPPLLALPATVEASHVAGLGAALYTEHLVTVELVGALLFVALIGALSIAAPKAPIRPSTSDAAANAGV